MKVFKPLTFFFVTLCFLYNCKAIGKSPEEKRKLVEMVVKNVLVDRNGNPVILLEDKNGTKRLPIWIGFAEARAIAMELEKVEVPRPMTHDLLKNILNTLEINVVKVVISDLKGSTFYAEIHLKGKRGRWIIDARPSDAIALSLRTNSPIYVVEDVIERSGLDVPEEEGGKVLYDKQLGLFLEELRPLVKEALELKGGLAVTEVEEGSEGEKIGLKPGDIIIMVNSEEVSTIEDFDKVITSSGIKSITVIRGNEKIELKK
jgi:bifunctional DNase/RNase